MINGDTANKGRPSCGICPFTWQTNATHRWDTERERATVPREVTLLQKALGLI